MHTAAYFLETERIGFRWWSLDDLPLAIELWGNHDVTRLFAKDRLSAEQVKERLLTEMERAEKYGIQYWPMFELGSNAHVGCAGLRPYRLQERVYEMGFHLRPEHWRKGYATEVGRKVVQYGFENLQANALFAGHHPENGSSRNVLLKLGFKQTGWEFFEPTGLMHPAYMLYPQPNQTAQSPVSG